MTETERDVLAALNQLEELVRSMKTADPKPDLLPVFARLDALAANLAPGGDPSLLHYLHKKSYEKARVYLQGRDAPSAPGVRPH